MAAHDSLRNPDPSATDDSSDNARQGAQKRRNPAEPAAVVGLGASAGGIAPLQQFFGDMKPDSGLAFVVVMHLSPEFESQLQNVIQQKTSMPVTQVSEPVKVQPNNVYVIPPNHQLAFDDGMLHLVPPQQAVGRRVTIDLFFRTLAQAYGQRAVCVILSGTDSDGVIGLKHIRAQGGLSIAQDPNEAEFESMPATAISTGMIDWVLPVADMPQKLLEFVHNEHRMKLPPEIPEAQEPDVKVEDAPGGETVSDETRAAEDEEAIGKVLADVRAQTGHDFSHYKRATILRRIARRLQVNSLETIPQYLEYIRTHPAEGRALLQDLLIGVTHFFRDRDSFAALEAHIPQLFAGKKEEDEVRVWVAGCATGDEAYSIAMLLCEHCDRLESPPKVQIFATDIDEESIADARDGLYPAMIEADVSPERLREFFVKDQGRYRVRKEIREKVLFAVHNIFREAPFSRCDMVSCRNLLIYLKPEAQQTIFDIFHFSLRTGGLLFLGGAENQAAAQSLFSPVDAKHRIFVRRSTPRPTWKLPSIPTRPAQTLARRPNAWRDRVLKPLTHEVAGDASASLSVAVHAAQTRRETLFGELHLRLLEEYGPPSVVVNEAHQVVHLSGSAGRYLQFAAGEPTADITKVVNPALAIELRTALFKAGRAKENAKGSPVLVELDGKMEAVTIEVRPMRENDQAEGFFLILFEKEGEDATVATAAAHDATARSADDEIAFLKQQLAATVEQYEATNEELKASNEELQAMNEEMRSATEELETSKEELQSVNEELTTVNHELKANVEELSRTNADLNNLMASTDIGTIFLDRHLRIHRFTPSAHKVFNLIPADLGRPISDITSRLHYDGFQQDLEQALENLRTIEREVRVGDEDQWYLTRVAPFRTSDDRIAGVVATFINITARKQAEEALRESHQQTVEILESINDAFYAVDADFKFTYINKKAEELWARKREALLGKQLWQEFPEAVGSESHRMHRVAAEERQVVQYETESASLKGWADVSIYPGPQGGLSVYFRDITGRKRNEEALRASEERFRTVADNVPQLIWTNDAEGKANYFNRRWFEYSGLTFEESAGSGWQPIVHPEDKPSATKKWRRALAEGNVFDCEFRLRRSDGAYRWFIARKVALRDADGKITSWFGSAADIDDLKRAEAALRESEERFRLLVEGARDYAMFMMDLDGTIIYWSRGAERIFGWSQEEAVGKKSEIIFVAEDRKKGVVAREITTALQHGRAPDRRWHERKDGSRLWVDGVMMRLDDPDGNPTRLAKVARDATDQQRADEEIRHARDQLEQRVLERTAELVATNNDLQREIEARQQLERDLLSISDRERRRLGQDLHDVVCQELTATALFLKSSSKNIADRASAKTLDEAAQVVNRNVGLARDLARGYQPEVVGRDGLVDALRTLCHRANQHPTITCRLKLPKPIRVSDENVALNLFRIAQEGVTNALKHSEATELLVCVEREGKNIRLVIEDNGKGLQQKKRSKGLGLHIMKYRANVLGGQLRIERPKGGGTEIICEVPIATKEGPGREKRP